MNCSICLSDCDKTSIHRTKCNHVFHTHCMLEWYSTSECFTCPLCRKSLPVQKWKQMEYDRQTTYIYEYSFNETLNVKEFNCDTKMFYISLLQNNFNILVEKNLSIQKFFDYYYYLAIHSIYLNIIFNVVFFNYLLFFICLSLRSSFIIQRLIKQTRFSWFTKK